jgi:tRNA(Ile2) C34 agmatinyltransferase TiaS
VLQRPRLCIVDLARMRGRGEFRCPKCRVEISPDDVTEDVYTIVEPVMRGGDLEKLIIRCNRCGTRIQLSGFDVLGRMQ